MKNPSRFLNIALVQSDLHWKSPGANMAMLEEKLWPLSQKTDLIILPEMFTTGFTMDADEMAEPMNFTTTKWMKQMAQHTGAVVTGSVIIKEKDKNYNRLLWVKPEGEVSSYDKRHLFRMAKEDEHFSMGDSNEILEVKGWKLKPQICYDLRFPVYSRNRVIGGQLEYDLVFYVANWPSARKSAWELLLPARAAENLSFCIGVNRIGEDGNGISYSGQSAVYDFKGQRIACAENEEKILLVELDHSSLSVFREGFPAWKDADKFELT